MAGAGSQPWLKGHPALSAKEGPGCRNLALSPTPGRGGPGGGWGALWLPPSAPCSPVGLAAASVALQHTHQGPASLQEGAAGSLKTWIQRRRCPPPPIQATSSSLIHIKLPPPRVLGAKRMEETRAGNCCCSHRGAVQGQLELVLQEEPTAVASRQTRPDPTRPALPPPPPSPLPSSPSPA